MKNNHADALLTLPISTIARLRYVLTSFWFALGFLVILSLLMPYTCALSQSQCNPILNDHWSHWLPLWSKPSTDAWDFMWHIALLISATLLVKYMTLNLLRGVFQTQLVFDATQWYWYIPALQLRFGHTDLNRVVCVDIHGRDIDQLFVLTPNSIALRSGFANWPLLTCHLRDFETYGNGLHHVPTLIILNQPHLKLRFFADKS